MKLLLLTGSLVFSAVSVVAQTNSDIPNGYELKAQVVINRPMGNVFESGAVLCAPDLTNPKNKYNYGYTFKFSKNLEVIEFKVTPDTDGPAGLIALRSESPDHQAGALQLDVAKNQISEKEIKFSGDSLDFTSVQNSDGSISFGLAPVAKITGTLSLESKTLNIHVVGSFAQDVEMKCEKMQ